MKRISSEQIQNMVYIVAVVIACAVIGLALGRGRDDAAPPPVATGTPEATAAPTEAPKDGVHADDVRFAFTSYGYAIEETSAKDADWIIENVPELGTVYLSCTKQDKRIVSLSVRVQAAAAPTPTPTRKPAATPKPTSAIERALGDGAQAGITDAYREALALLLEVSAMALSGGDAFDAATLAHWADGAAETLTTGKASRTENERAAFTSVRQSGVQFDSLLCTVALKGD